MKSKLNSITQAQGIFSSCGPGIDEYELSYNCRGPGCTAISGFQNVICNSDSHGMTCSNNVKCPGGTSSLQSNFTFGQNELDPWSPNWANQQDILVPQQQDISISDCARFSLTSDGTSDGTQIDVGDLTGCSQTQSRMQSRPQKTPIAMAEAGFALPTSSLISGSNVDNTGRPKLQQSSKGTKLTVSRSTIFLAVILVLLLFAPGTHAASSNIRKDNLRERPEVRVRQVSDKVRVFANGLSADIANIANAPGQDSKVFAHNLVANVVTSVCIKYYQGNAPNQFTPAVVQDCVKSVYGGDPATLPASHFLAVFGASLLCNYVVSAAYPVAQDFVQDGCEGLQELAYGAPPAMSPIALSQSTPTISSIARSPIKIISEATTSSENTGKPSSTSFSSATGHTIPEVASSVFVSPSPLSAIVSSTALDLLASISRTTSASRILQETLQPVDTSTNSASSADINSRSTPSTTVGETLGSSLSVSSPLVFPQLASSSEARASSINLLASFSEPSMDPILAVQTSGSVPILAPGSESLKSTSLSFQTVSTPLASPISSFAATPYNTVMARFSSTTASALQVQSSSSLNAASSQPKSNLSSSSSTHYYHIASVPSIKSIAFDSPHLSSNTSSEAAIQSPSQLSVETTPAPDGQPAMISSPPSVINKNSSTTRQLSNWTFANTGSYATFLHTTPPNNGNYLDRSFSAASTNSSMPPVYKLNPVSTSNRMTNNSTHSAMLHTTSIMAPTRVNAVQTVLLTTVVVLLDTEIATTTSTTPAFATSSNTLSTQPSTKTIYKGAGGFIAKGFDGLWR